MTKDELIALAERFPNLLAAFRTTQNGQDGYRMVFKFPTMGSMHAADDEWRVLLDIAGAALVAHATTLGD